MLLGREFRVRLLMSANVASSRIILFVFIDFRLVGNLISNCVIFSGLVIFLCVCCLKVYCAGFF